MADLIPLAPSIEQIGRIIGTVASPAFLLGAVAAFISVIMVRFNRVIDRSHYIHGLAEEDSRAFLKSDLPRLRYRASLLNRALFFSVIAAILTSMIIIIAFISALFHLAHEYGAAVLFIAALSLFCAGLVDLARETRLALHQNDLHG